MRHSVMEDLLHVYFPLGFAVGREAQERYGLTALLRERAADATGGDPAVAADSAGDFHTIRLLAERMNKARSGGTVPLPPVQAGHLIAVGMIVDVLRYVAGMYCHEENAGVVARSIDWIRRNSGPATSDRPPPAFVQLYPPVEVALGDRKPDDFLKQSRQRIANFDTAAIEMILLYLAMSNPAFKPYRDLFDDRDLQARAPYVPLVLSQEQYFAGQPALEPLGMTLFHCLRAPMLASPDSLEDQLEYIRLHWAELLPGFLVRRLQLARGVLAEEKRLRGLGPGPAQVLEFTRDAYRDLGYPEPEAFSRDADWMSNVVLIAKSVYVWLDQLSRAYGREIRLLSDVPDEELDRLARWGFTGLWLIGVWERSRASQKIKQWMGNPEAVASAYSLHDYTIAADLGGEEAYGNLKDRAWRRGIRLASDMVPNHMGIDSRWLVEHPHWFLQLDQPPYPWYSFGGGDLCDDERVGVFIEDGYWERRDAAVVFKRLDRHTGRECYIYHGNDGTSMPWNDTAQLDFTLPEVREAVIQTILHVARKFSIIRFDAAMTLAKKHYQRLWFPAPGDEGAIPTRAERGLNRAEFDRLVPKEFWREVVDRIQAELPETLLLAEAFWLMEGYFVRTLGMHRVYNSAFMNMLKMEENSKYRQTIKNVLQFSPEVLKRFVNFMNNPDERTAVEQFGKGDKYFGVAVMLATLPGLPMFGHGQIEGFTEKYGMEYRRAYWDEQVDEQMVRRHEAEIFPLMRRRRLFSGAVNFAFFDFKTPEGWVDENVFAYCNRAGDERAVILINNAYNTTSGWIHTSTPINFGSSNEPALAHRTLAEALSLESAGDCFYAFTDHRTGLQYLRSGGQIARDGLFFELGGYQYCACVDFRELRDSDGRWRRLADNLDGRGVPDLEVAARLIVLEPIHEPFARLLDAARQPPGGKAGRPDEPWRESMREFLFAAARFGGEPEPTAGELEDALELIETVAAAAAEAASTLPSGQAAKLWRSLRLSDDRSLQDVLTAWAALRNLGGASGPRDAEQKRAACRQRLADWLLIRKTAEVLADRHGDPEAARADARLLEIALIEDNVLVAALKGSMADLFGAAVQQPAIREYLLVNQYQGHLYLSKERLERLVRLWWAIGILNLQREGRADPARTEKLCSLMQGILAAAERSGYRVKSLIESLTA